MLKNYLTIALRNLLKSPGLSFIKIFGLGIGVAGCMIVFSLGRLELSFDKFHTDGDKVYRIYTRFTGVYEGVNAAVPLPFPAAFRERAKGVEAVSQVITDNLNVIIPEPSGNQRAFATPNYIAFADSNYFKVFVDHRWIVGSPKSLDDPFSVVLTESKAKVYFGVLDLSHIIGRKVIYRDSLEMTVVGVISDPPGNTDLNFTDFISLSTTQRDPLKQEFNYKNWDQISSTWMCLFRLSSNADITEINKLLQVIAKERDDRAARTLQSLTTFDSFVTQPLSDIHFNMELGTWDHGRSSTSIGTIKALIAIALLILVVAVINFVNLETAQALRRAREIGVRKVMGGTRGSLMLSFLVESLMVTGIAVLLALPLSRLTRIFFSEFLPKDLAIDLTDAYVFVFMISITAIVAVLAGIYPAMVLSSYQPATTLRMNTFSGRPGSALMRKVLTVFQFTFSQVLIAGALIIGLQIAWMLDKDIGFTHDPVVNIQTPWWEKKSKRTALRNELAQLSFVSMTNQNTRPPVSQGRNTTTLIYNNGKEDIPLTVNVSEGDTSYLKLFGLQLIAGRNIMPADSLMEIVINKTYCSKLGIMPIEVIGKDVKTGGGQFYHIVGVLDDFNFRSLHHAIEPWLFRHKINQSIISVRFAKNTNISNAIDLITKASKRIYEDQEVEIQFMDDIVRKFYENEKRISKLANTATGLAIFISCLGLFGLASFTSIQRTKEIGIRKVLGASVNSIIAMLSHEFLVLIVISLAFAIPVAWYAGNEWLNTFPYRMELGIWIFLVPGATSVVVAFIVVGLRAMKAAIASPLDSLRCE